MMVLSGPVKAALHVLEYHCGMNVVTPTAEEVKRVRSQAERVREAVLPLGQLARLVIQRELEREAGSRAVNV